MCVMATALDPTLTNKEFQNWIKAALAILFAKEGLTEFVQIETSDLHKDVFQSVFQQNGISPGTICSSCTTANLLPCLTPSFCNKGRRCYVHDKSIPDKIPNQICPNRVCNAVKDAIRFEHTFNDPSWKNSDAKQWYSDAFEMAKCFMPPDGYADKKSLAETDFNGTLAVIINSKRFQNKMAAQLNVEPNVCSRAREVGREVRHAAGYMLSDVKLARYIDALRDLLRDSKYLRNDKNAQDAVNKLNELQNNTLMITAGDITKVFDDNIRKTIGQEQCQVIQTIRDHFCTVQTESIANLEEVLANRKFTILEEIQKKADEEKEKINKLGQQQFDRVLYTRKKMDEQLRTKSDDEILYDLQEDLIEYYLDNECMIPASPLVDECAAHINDFYVQPPMSAFCEPNAFGPGKKLDAKTSVKSFKQLFFKDDNLPYRKIYMTGGAGMGKTSFSQKIAMTWCQAYMPEKIISSNCTAEDVNTMRCFEFLFLIHLREYLDTDMCFIDDMVYDMVSKATSRNQQYSKEFLQKCLHDGNCFIILDGLDEWRHPKNCPKKPEVPHNNHPNSCTVLTTTREWKLSTSALPPNHIDRHLEISQLDDATSDKLKINALQVFQASNSIKENKPQNRLADFDKTVSAIKLGDILLNPFILLQILCIWLDGIPIGKSRCEIYGNVAEMTIERGLKKKNVPGLPLQQHTDVEVPKFLENKHLCNRYICLLLKLAEIAFLMLFNVMKESRLLIDSELVLKYFTEQEMDFCLKVGLLSETKDKGLITRRRYKIFFQHKSIQEFYAALHIASNWNIHSIQMTIQTVCSSLPDILEMSNVFVFLSGMNPNAYSLIALRFQKVVECDNITCRQRNDINGYHRSDAKLIRSYQSMQISCLEENAKNESERWSVPLQDVVLDDMAFFSDDDVTAIKTILNVGTGTVKSIILDMWKAEGRLPSLVQTIDPGVYCSVETLRVSLSVKCEETIRKFLVDILAKQAHTLIFLEFYGFSLPSSDIVTAITTSPNLKLLQTLQLSVIKLIHSDIERLCSFLSTYTTLRRLRLTSVQCRAHGRLCKSIDLDLSQHSKLEAIYLEQMDAFQVRVNSACLEHCRMYYVFISPSAESTFFEDLRGAPVLSLLHLTYPLHSVDIVETISTLNKLKELRVESIDMSLRTLRILPETTGLEIVKLSEVTMTVSAWKKLFLNIGNLPQSVTLEIEDCQAKPTDTLDEDDCQASPMELPRFHASPWEGWEAVVNEIKLMPCLEMNDLKLKMYKASFTLKFMEVGSTKIIYSRGH